MADKFVPAAEQPPVVEIRMADDIFVKQIVIGRAGSFVPQHAHTWDHLSMIAAGSVNVWSDGRFLGKYRAPTGIVIEANAKHLFVTLEDNTIIYCIHSISRSGEVDIAHEHQIVGAV